VLRYRNLDNYISPNIIDFYLNYYRLYRAAMVKKYQALNGSKSSAS
jgi:hypothetical protein